MAWHPWTVEWSQDATAELADLAHRGHEAIAECVRALVRTYAKQGHGDVIDDMGKRWRGFGRLKPRQTAICARWRVVFQAWPHQRVLRIARVRTRDVVYLDAPRSRKPR